MGTYKDFFLTETMIMKRICTWMLTAMMVKAQCPMHMTMTTTKESSPL